MQLRRHRRGLAALDGRLFARVARSRVPALDATLPRLSRSADHALLWHLSALALARFGGRAGRRAAARGSASIAVTSAIVNLAIKRAARRPRPSLRRVPVARRLRSEPLTTSFPSGHAASAFAFTAAAGGELPRFAVPLGAVASAVAFSRVYTGVHYPADVAFGAALGCAVGLASGAVRTAPSRAPGPPRARRRR